MGYYFAFIWVVLPYVALCARLGVCMRYFDDIYA